MVKIDPDLQLTSPGVEYSSTSSSGIGSMWAELARKSDLPAIRSLGRFLAGDPQTCVGAGNAICVDATYTKSENTALFVYSIRAEGKEASGSVQHALPTNWPARDADPHTRVAFHQVMFKIYRTDANLVFAEINRLIE
jgi:hypothetical protein